MQTCDPQQPSVHPACALSPYIGGGAVGGCEKDEAGQDDEHVQQHSSTPADSISQEAKEQLPYEDAHQLQVGGGLGPGLQSQRDTCVRSCPLRGDGGCKVAMQADDGRRII